MKWLPMCRIPDVLFVQVQILSKLHHPHIISLVGVCLRPKAMLVLEYAELGSLSSMKPYSNMSMPLKHRIALQVCQSGSWDVSVRVMGFVSQGHGVCQSGSWGVSVRVMECVGQGQLGSWVCRSGSWGVFSLFHQT